MFSKSKLLYFIFTCFLASLTKVSFAGGEIATSYSRARFLGDLSTEKSAPLYGFHFRHWHEPQGLSPLLNLKAGLSLDVLSIKTRHDGNVFPYRQDEEIRILAFLFLPTVCLHSNNLDMQVCGAIGQGTVNVNTDDNRQDYGTWNYQADLKWGQEIMIGLMTKFVGKVEQRVEGRDSEFSFASLGVSLGKTF